MFCFTKCFVPTSTAEKEIFPLNSCSYNYHTGDFDHNFANSRTNLEEINQVINTIQVTHQPFVSKKRLFDFLFVLSFLTVLAITVCIRLAFFGVDSTWGLVVMILLIFVSIPAIDQMHNKKILKIFLD